MDRLSKIQIIVAAIAAAVSLVLRSWMLAEDYGALTGGLEALSFILCAVAVLNSGRELRTRYQHLSFDKRVARQSVEYIQMRQSVRWWSYFAALIIAALAATRFDVSVLMVVGAVALALPVFMIVADQASGWRGRTET
jgi:urea transporter